MIARERERECVCVCASERASEREGFGGSLCLALLLVFSLPFWLHHGGDRLCRSFCPFCFILISICCRLFFFSSFGQRHRVVSRLTVLHACHDDGVINVSSINGHACYCYIASV